MLKSAASPKKSILKKVSDSKGSNDVDGGGIEIAKKSGKSKG